MKRFRITTPTRVYLISALNIWAAISALGIDIRGIWWTETKETT